MSHPTASTGRRERRKQEVRERILGAAESLFLEQGFDATTVDQIAAAADVAQKTFFNHFSTKLAVFEEFASARVALFGEVVLAVRARPGSTLDRLEFTFGLMADQSPETVTHLRDLALHLMRAAPTSSTGREQLNTMQASIGGLLEDGQAQGDVRRDHSIEFLADLVVGAYSMIVIQWAKDPSYPLRERLQQTARFLGEAIRPPGSA